MPLTPQETILFRHIEETVLDRKHLGFELLQYDIDSAIRSLVQCFDQSICEAIRAGKGDHYVSQIGNAGTRGLPRAVKWFQSRDGSPASQVVLGGNPPRQAAADLLRWAIAYDKVYNQHVALGRRMVDVAIHNSQKVITFRPTFQFDPKYFVSQQEAMADADRRKREAFPDIEPLASRWTDSINCHAGGWSANDSLLLRSGAVDKVEMWLNSFCLPELASAQSLGPFTMGELRRFLAALYCYSHCHTKIQNGTNLPITITEMSHTGFIDWLCTLTGSSREVLSETARVFQYHIEHPKITLGQKPLVQTPSRIVFSPYIIDGLAPDQLVIGALKACDPTQAAYSNAINTIETEGVKAIQQKLLSLLPDCRILRQPDLNFSDGQSYTPDIVVYQPSTNHILVSDIKFSCQPFSTGDVYSDIQEFREWKSKMIEYVEHIRREPIQVLRQINGQVTAKPSVLGLICPRWPLAVPIDFETPLAAVDYGSLISRLEESGEVPLAELHDWAAHRPDVQVASGVFEVTKEVNVDDWTYKYIVLEPRNESNTD